MGKMYDGSYGYSKLTRREIRHSHDGPEISTGKVRTARKRCRMAKDGKHEFITSVIQTNTTVVETYACKNCGKVYERPRNNLVTNYFSRRAEAARVEYYREMHERIKNMKPKQGRSKGIRYE